MTIEDQREGEATYQTEGHAEETVGKGVRGRIQDELTVTARSLTDEQKTRAARGLDVAVRAIRRTSADLHKEEFESTAKYMDLVAEQVDQFSDYIRGVDINDLLNDIESSIRRRPGAAIALGVAAGFLLARFLKSSSPAPPREGPDATPRRTVF